MNTELLRRVAAFGLMYPDNQDMNYWARGDFVADKEHGPSCGTAACVYGTAKAIVDGVMPNMPCARIEFVQKDGMALLQLKKAQFRRLCILENWPRKFMDEYLDAKDEDNHALAAQIVAERIEHFIATEGRE